MPFGERNGYKTFIDTDGQEKFVHIRVMEKKLGGPIPDGLVVHHIDGNKDNNRPENLVAITRGVHARLHGRYPDACYRCGREGHWVEDCRYKTDYAGKPLRFFA
jgi:HNH endonuclease/GAG-polyprotein viral zinc-finger